MEESALATGRLGRMGGDLRDRRASHTERHARIKEIFQRQPYYSTVELSTMLHVTTMTVRRDLQELARLGVLSVVHGGARLADEDSLLAFAFAVDGGRDARQPRTFFKVVDDHRGGVGKLFLCFHENSLANYLRCHEARRLIGNLVFRKVWRPGRQRGRDFF